MIPNIKIKRVSDFRNSKIISKNVFRTIGREYTHHNGEHENAQSFNNTIIIVW